MTQWPEAKIGFPMKRNCHSLPFGTFGTGTFHLLEEIIILGIYVIRSAKKASQVSQIRASSAHSTWEIVHWWIEAAVESDGLRYPSGVISD